MAKKTSQEIERTYTIPLRKEFRKVANWKQSKKAIKAVREYLVKHMKSEDVRVGTSVNEEVWKHGIKNPPHKVKVVASKDKDGVVRAELFGAKTAAPKKEVKKAPAKKVTKEAQSSKATSTESKTPAPKAEEKTTPAAEPAKEEAKKE